MLLLVEIGLTAWLCVRLSQAGKNWLLGLLPIIVTGILGLCLGVTIGLSGVKATDLNIFSLLGLDFVAIIVMIVMIVQTKPKPK